MTTFVKECGPEVNEEDYYVTLPPTKCANAKFPLQCRVILLVPRNNSEAAETGARGAVVETERGTRSLDNNNKVYSGTVVEIGIDIGSPLPQKRSNLYKIQ